EGGVVGLDLAPWDPTRPLLVDPVLPVGGLFGPTGAEDSAAAVVVAPDGASYVTGGGRQAGSSSEDAFVLALTRAGELAWLAWFGGTRDHLLPPTCAELVVPSDPNSDCKTWQAHPVGAGGADAGVAIAVAGDRLAVVGRTVSVDFPVTAPIMAAPALGPEPTQRSRRDGFLLVLDRASGAPVMSTYLAGDDNDLVNDVFFDAPDTIAVAGGTNSAPWGPAAGAPPAAHRGLYAFAYTVKRAAGAPERWEAAPVYGAAPFVAVQPAGQSLFQRVVDVGGERWFLGANDLAPLRWRPAGPGRPAPVTDWLGATAGAELMDAHFIYRDAAGRAAVILVGTAAGALRGFDGQPCGNVVGAGCDDGTCKASDAYVLWMVGDHCATALHVGGSGPEVLFDSARARFDDRDLLVLAGRTGSGDLPVRAAAQPQAGQAVGAGVDGFLAVVDLKKGGASVVTYLGGAPSPLSDVLTSDDVLRGVAVSADREAVVVGETRTTFLDFARELGFHAPLNPVTERGQAVVARMPLEVADVSLTLAFAEPVVPTSQATTLSLTIANAGTVDARGVAVELDTGGLTFTANAACEPGTTPESLVCRPPGGVVAEGASAVLELGVTAPATEGIYFVNGVATAASYDPNHANERAGAQLRVGGIDFAPTVVIAPPSIATDSGGKRAVAPVDGAVHARVSVRNAATTATRARVTIASTTPLRATLPAGSPCQAASCGGASCLPLTCDTPSLSRASAEADGVVGVFAFSHRDPAQVDGGGVTARVTVTTTALDGLTDAFPGNDVDTLVIDLRRPDAVAAAGTADPKTVAWGKAAVAKLVATDLGPGHLAAMRFELTPTPFLPGALPATCQAAGSPVKITCTIARPPEAPEVGAVYLLDVPLVAPAANAGVAAGTFDLPFTVGDPAKDPTPRDNAAKVTIAIHTVDVRVAGPDPEPRLPTHKPIDLVWTVSNAADEDAHDVVVTRTFGHPKGVRVSRARALGSDCAVTPAATSSKVVCTLPTLAAHQSTPLETRLEALGRGSVSLEVTVATREANASRAVVLTSLTAVGPELRPTLALASPEVVRGKPTSVDFGVTSDEIGASPPTGSPLKLTIPLPVTVGASSGTAGTPTATDLPLGVPGDAAAGKTLGYALAFPGGPGGAFVGSVAVTPTRVGSTHVTLDAADPNDEDTANDRQRAFLTVHGADLSLGLGVPKTAERGARFTVAAAIDNAGPADAADPRLTLSFATADLAPVEPTASGCTIVRDPAKTELRCDRPALNGEVVIYPIELTALAAGDKVLSFALAQRGDPWEPKLDAKRTVSVTGPDVAVEQAGVTPRAVVTRGQDVEARFRVQNLSENAAASGVVVAVTHAAAGVGDCAAPLTDITLAADAPCTVAAGGASFRCDLAAREVATVKVAMRAACAGSQKTTLEATPKDPEADTTNNRAWATVAVEAPALAVAVTPAPISGPHEQALTGTITVSDAGGAGVGVGPGEAIKVEAPLPAPFELVSATPSSGSCSGSQSKVSCELGALPANGSATIAISARSTAGPAVRELKVTATPPGGDPATGRGTLRARGADLALTVVSAPSGKLTGERGEWVLRVDNLGTGAAESPAIAITEPSALIEAVTVDGVTSCAATTSGRVCRLPATVEAAGGSATVTFGARFRRAGDVLIPARVTSRYEPDEVPTNNAGNLETRVRGPNHAVGVAALPDLAAPGAPVTVQLTVQNVGDADAPATTASLALGARLAVQSLGAGCTASQGVARCPVAPLSVGDGVTFNFQIAGATPSANTLVAEIARVGDDTDASNDRDVATLVIQGPDSDGDGVPDAQEDQGPNGGDANGDGVPDGSQGNVTSVAIPKYGPFIAESAAGTLLQLTAATTSVPLPESVTGPIGTFTFKVFGVTPGGLTTIRFTFPSGVPAGSWWKLVGAQWSEFTWDGTTGARVVSPQVLELVIRDGGRGDEDGVANGVVVDPGAPTLLVLRVDDAGDGGDAAPGDGLCAQTGGGCTLRAALEEVNALGEARYVVLAFDAPATIAPGAAFPPATTPIVVDATGVAAGDGPGVTLSGASAGAVTSLLAFAVPGCGLAGVKLVDVAGDGLLVTAPGARVADSWLGRPYFSGFGSPPVHAALRGEGADRLRVTATWLGLTGDRARYGLDVSGADVVVEDVRVNLSPLDGERPMGNLPVGVQLRDAPRALLERLAIGGGQTGVRVTGDAAGAVLRDSVLGLGADGLCHAFTRDDPGPAATGRGPCLDQTYVGVSLDDAHGFTVGGLDPGDRNAFGNHATAIEIVGGSSGNRVLGNLIGLAADGTCQPAPDLGVATLYDGLCRLYTADGVLIADSPDNLVGLPGAGNTFGAAALRVTGAGATDTRVEGNWLGLFSDHVTPVLPGFTSLAAATVHVMGGASGTRIVDNTLSGVVVEGAATADTLLLDNRVGLLPSGLALPAPTGGFDTYWRTWPRGVIVRDGAPRTRVVGGVIASASAPCVVFEGAVDPGVEDALVGLTRDARAVTVCQDGGLLVQGGTTGAVARGNRFGACGVDASAELRRACARVGGTSVGGGARGTALTDNVFGLLGGPDAGTWGEVVAYPNPVVILEEAPATRLVGNTLLGGAPWAVYDRASFFGDYADPEDGAVLLGNRVGVDPDGARRGAPSGHGILAVGSYATIGGVGPGEGNVIVGAGGAGIAVGQVAGVVVRGDVLADNGGLGVSLGGGDCPLPNDPGDTDGGANGGQNHPRVGGYVADPPSAVATLGSRADTAYVIDVYAVAAPDPSGHGEADAWLGQASVTTDAAGDGAVTVALARALLPGERLTAIATGPDGSSELGPAARPDAVGVADLRLSLYAEPAATGAWGYVVVAVENAGPDAAPNATATLTAPAGVELGAILDIEGGSCAGDAASATCELGTLPSGAFWQVVYAVRSSVPGRYDLAVTADSDASDPASCDDVDSVGFTVGSVGYLLTGQLRDHQSQWPAGSAVPIDLTVHRWNFAGAIDGLTAAATVPGGAVVVGGTHPCAQDGATVTCALGTLAAGAPTLTATIELAFPSAGAYEVPVRVEAAGPNREGLALATVYPTILAAAPALSLALDGPPAAAPAGTTQAWTATVGNARATALDGVVLALDVPPGAVYRGADAACGFVDDAVLCLLDAVPASGERVVTVLLDAPPASGVVAACARRDVGAGPPDEACASASVAVSAVDRAVTTTTPLVAIERGALAPLVFRVASATGAAATTLAVTADGPLDDALAPDCARDGAALTCDVPALAPGGVAEVALELVPGAASTLRLTARLADPADANPDNDVADALLLVSAAGECGADDAVPLFVDGEGAALDADGLNAAAATEMYALSLPGALPVSDVQWLSAADVRAVQVIPSGDVITRSAVPLRATATNIS
ncbi:MAG: hypothetical protein KC635_12385, partial [Myxococcales bacterium]|nr:hypothetical protein [Myxococcales bacterium]